MCINFRPETSGMADLWPAMFTYAINEPKPVSVFIDNPTAYIVFKAGIHFHPKKGFEFEVIRRGNEIITTTPANETDVSTFPPPELPAGATLEK
jgi:hypothetical protein